MDAVDVLIEDHTRMEKSMKELATMQQPGLTRTSFTPARLCQGSQC